MNKLSKLCLATAIIVASAPLTSVSAANYQTTTVTYPYYGFVEDPENPWSTVYDALDETGTVEYSDEFFSEPSPGDHPELRAASYALALAGFENEADGYPSTSTDKNPKLINFLNQMGFSDYEIWDTKSDENGYSMGTTIGRKTLSTGEDLIVIAPRNYNYMTEWLSNLNVGTSGDHAGFTDSAILVASRFNQYLSDRNLSNYKLWVTGYSRGGAVVDLFAKYLNEDINNYNLSSDNLYAYTFGAPRASVTETKYSNIHDVKDGNDLILGNVFPEVWGFYNTGTYEEIHPADLEITASVVDISGLVNSSTALNVLATNQEITKEVGIINGKEFMNNWFNFVNESGLTREYFNNEVKEPLSKILQAYQLRTLDKQSDFTNFIIDTNKGLANMVAVNAFMDLSNYGSDIEEALANFPPYLDLIKVLQGTATESNVDELLTFLTRYMGNYSDYETAHGEAPAITEAEFNLLKENLPKLVKALSPIIIADAKYTKETYGSDYSLYYTYTLADNIESMVYGHIPESIMPLLKSLIPAEPIEPEENIIVPKVPNTGAK